ncbi:RNA polymerase subunit sigma-70, partial [Streptomyces fradiae]
PPPAWGGARPGRVAALGCLEVTAEGIAAVRNQVNPDKLVRATALWAAGGFGGTPLHTL